VSGLTPNDLILRFLDGLPIAIRASMIENVAWGLGKKLRFNDAIAAARAVSMINPRRPAERRRKAIQIAGLIDHLVAIDRGETAAERIGNSERPGAVRSIVPLQELQARQRWRALRRGPLSPAALDGFDGYLPP
jgi:hypothetical protein